MRISLLILFYLSSLAAAYADFSWKPFQLVNGCRLFIPAQQVKMMDLKRFLTHWK